MPSARSITPAPRERWSRAWRRAASLAVLSGAALAAGCQGNGDPELPRTFGTGGSSGARGVGGDQGIGGQDAGELPDVVDAGSSPVLVGITANPRLAEGDAGTVAQVLEAQLVTLAAGVRVAVISRPWRDFDAPGVDAVAAAAAFWAEHGRKVHVEIAVIDRAADGRPGPGTAPPWEDPGSLSAIELTIDVLLARLGDELSFLSIGRDVDVYLGSHEVEREGFESFGAHAVSYAREHPMAPRGLRVGIGFSFEGAVVPDASFAELHGAGDLTVISYLPGLGADAVPPPTGVVGDMDALIAVAQDKPIVLAALGTTSAVGVGSSRDAQALFYASFFEALAPRRGAFAVVNAFQLHDLGPDACDAHAAGQAEPPDGSFAGYACAAGLRTVEGDDKPAWLEVLAGSARFASP